MEDNILYIQLPICGHSFCLELISKSENLLRLFEDEIHKILREEKYWFWQGNCLDWKRVEYFGKDEDYLLSIAEKVSKNLSIPLDIV